MEFIDIFDEINARLRNLESSTKCLQAENLVMRTTLERISKSRVYGIEDDFMSVFGEVCEEFLKDESRETLTQDTIPGITPQV